MSSLKKILLLISIVVSLTACAPALYKAAYRGNNQDVMSLIASGKDVNEKERHGWTPLMIAAAEGHADTVAILLKNGADTNARNEYGRTALMFASHYGFTPIAEQLIKAGAEVNAIPTDTWGRPALIAAIDSGHLDTVSLLLEHGADMKAKDLGGFDAILSASVDGRMQIAELLLQKGANPNVRNARGNTPLMISIYRGFTDYAILLLSHGADPNLPQLMTDYSPLMTAVKKGDVVAVRALIEKGAKVNAKDNYGNTALIYAIDAGNAEIGRLLIAAGATQ